MEVKEPLGTYSSIPSIPIMKGRLIKAIEKDDNSILIQTLYAIMIGLTNEQSNILPKYSLSSLEGVLASDNPDTSYEDMRLSYMKEKYSL